MSTPPHYLLHSYLALSPTFWGEETTPLVLCFSSPQTPHLSQDQGGWVGRLVNIYLFPKLLLQLHRHLPKLAPVVTYQQFISKITL